jgi:predicted permease
VQNAYTQLWQRLSAIPGVERAGNITSLPLSGHMAWGPITIEGYVPPGGEDFINADQRIVGGDYFEAMRIPLVAGRYFAASDHPDAQRVVIVDEYLAEQYWPGESAIGKRLRTGPISSNSTNWLTVVGVVSQVKQYGANGESRVVIYLPHSQYPARSGYVTLRTSGDPAAIVAPVRQAIREFDAELPMYRVRTMEERVDASLARARFARTLLTIFAALALVLAAIGIYGVLAYLVSQSTRDIGIRLALGATEQNVLRLVLQQGAAVTAAGLVLGLFGAWALSRFMESLLFGVSGTDSGTFIAVALLLVPVSLAATLIPARRAARVDPMVALRVE